MEGRSHSGTEIPTSIAWLVCTTSSQDTKIWVCGGSLMSMMWL